MKENFSSNWDQSMIPINEIIGCKSVAVSKKLGDSLCRRDWILWWLWPWRGRLGGCAGGRQGHPREGELAETAGRESSTAWTHSQYMFTHTHAYIWIPNTKFVYTDTDIWKPEPLLAPLGTHMIPPIHQDNTSGVSDGTMKILRRGVFFSCYALLWDECELCGIPWVAIQSNCSDTVTLEWLKPKKVVSLTNTSTWVHKAELTKTTVNRVTIHYFWFQTYTFVRQPIAFYLRVCPATTWHLSDKWLASWACSVHSHLHSGQCTMHSANCVHSGQAIWLGLGTLLYCILLRLTQSEQSLCKVDSAMHRKPCAQWTTWYLSSSMNCASVSSITLPETSVSNNHTGCFF